MNNYKLVSAAYSASSWNSFKCALNCLKLFEFRKGENLVWPLTIQQVCEFIEWCFYIKKLNVGSIKSYVSNIATLHKLNSLSHNTFSSFLVISSLKGVENLSFGKGKK